MNQINSEHFDNFKSVAVALKLTVDGLQDFVQENLQSLHQNIYKKCSVGRCHDNCSRKYGDRFSQWCSTCQAWKKELHRQNRYRKHWDNIKWKNIDTMDFPYSYEEASKVFVQDLSHGRQGLLEDLGALMSLFRNVRIFNSIINDNIIGDILRTRNTYFAHNYALSLHGVEKAQCLNCLIALFKIPEIACTQSAKTVINLLEELMMSQDIPERILKKPNVQNTLAVIQNVFHRKAYGKLEENTIANLFYNDNENFHIKRFKDVQTTKRRNRMVKFLRFAIFLTTLGIGTFIILYGLLSKDTIPVKGCLSVRFNEYWMSALDFDSYVEEISSVSTIERSWILRKIETHNDTERKGILMSADMGFGKSTIVSDIVCADQKSIWYSLRQQVLVYHMCRYDLISSSKPEVFVRNLAGAIVREIPEIGYSILSDDMALDSLYDKCSLDPVACLEFSVLNKLKHFNDNREYLIIIDAIDECETSGGNDLVDLLYKRISFFPDNFQFLITTRKIERLIYKFKQLEHIDLQFNEQNIMRDMRLYLEKSGGLTNEEVVKLTEISGINFLHVNLYHKYCKDWSKDGCDSMPESLEKLYQLNFERVFGVKGDLFEEFISVFEVLCSLQNPIDEITLLEVIDPKSKETKRKASQILGNELRHFIKITNGYIFFQHKSIRDFLTDPLRKHLKFYIQSQNGHKLFAKYLLNVFNLSKTDNLVDVVYHVAMSGEPEYENILIRYTRDLKNERVIYNATYLNLAAKDLNCYKTLKLFIKLIIPNVLHQSDNLFKDNRTWIQNILSESAFTAAQIGNENSLLALLDSGSDIVYVHHNFSLSLLFTTYEGYITMCKYELFCGYTMLHIAAQRGNIKIVRNLLRRNVNLLYQQNTMQMNAFHLAAENGHAPVLHFFLSINSTLADSQSLYLASKNGHTKIVVLLLRYVEEKCLPCNVDLSWRPISRPVEETEDGRFFDKTLMDFNMTLIMTTVENPELWKKKLEDMKFITCDTALNAAVRMGHIEIVKKLIYKSVKTVNCSIYDGSIPLFTAVKYNQNEIFKLLYNISDLSHKCNGIDIDQSKLTKPEKQITNFNRCPEYARVEHLLAIYDNLKLIKYHFQKGNRNWESRDKQGCTPLHHAFCHGSNQFVNYFLFENRIGLNLSSRSTNGSTPFHSAATCQSVILHQYFEKMNESNLPDIPDVEDYDGHSILQYGLNKSVSADKLIGMEQLSKDDFILSLFEVVLSCHHNLLHTDKHNNNFLHYASKAGNYWAFSLIRDFRLLHVLLNQHNQNNRTPLEVAFDSLPKRKSFEVETIKDPFNCSWTDFFFLKCKDIDFSSLLSPHEYFIFTVFKFIYKTGTFSELNLEELLEISINKSQIIPIIMMKVYAKWEVDSILEKSFKIPILLSKCNSHYIIELLLDINKALRCDGKKSPLHEIVHNDRIIQWTFYSLSFFNILFKQYPAKYLDTCFDDRGHNLLHRSIMGANLKTIKYLISEGMDLWQPSKDNKTALEISIYYSLYTDNGIIPTYYRLSSQYQIIQNLNAVPVTTFHNEKVVYDSNGLISFDETATFLLNITEKKRQLIRNQLCDSNHKGLGLIHIAAAKGLLLFLQRVKEIYGMEFLRCEDRFGIAPIYIAHIYKQHVIVDWLKKLKLDITRPEKRSENVLLYNMIDNYNSQNEYDWTCFLRYRYKYTAMVRNQILKCVKNIPLSILHSWIFNNETFSTLRNLISSNDFNFPISESNMKILHWISRNNITKDNLQSTVKTETHHLISSNGNLCFHKFVQSKGYNMMRRLMMFGAGDKEVYYVQLGLLVEKELHAYRENTALNISILFYDVYGKYHKHFRKLRMRSVFHRQWFKQTQIHLTDDFEIFLKYKKDLLKPNDFQLISKMCKNALNLSQKLFAKKEDKQV